MTRGIKQSRDIWVAAMQSQFYPWTRRNLQTGKEETVSVQGALRPIELWEYVFPEESLPEVLTMLNLADGAKGDFGHGWASYGVPLLRKALNAQPVPNVKPIVTNKFIPHLGFGANPIGIKKDVKKEWKDIGYFQEML
jgi:hypothetical protein